MTEPNWTDIVTQQAVNAARDKLWARVCDYICGPRKLRVQATGTWNYDPHSPCGPDGCPQEGFEDNNLHKSALRGCLIAKVGGGAGDTPGDGKIQAVGSFCVFEVAQDVRGALFLTMNDSPNRFYLHCGSLTVTISEAP